MKNKKQYATHQMWIKKGHRLYPYFREMTENAKNLYNVTNYYIRQVYTALHNEKGLHPLQQEVLDILESNLCPLNETQRIAFEKRRARELKKPIEEQKEIKITLFQLPTKEKSFLNFRLLDALFKQIQQVDYRSLPIHSSQAVMRMVQQNWISFFRSLKDYKINPEKYKGKPGIPRYERNIQKEVYFSNQECSIQEGKYVKFPRTETRLNIGKLGLSSGRFKQVRVLPRYHQFLVEVVMEIEGPPLVEHEPNRIMGIDLGLNNVAALVTNTGMTPILFGGKPIKSINQYYNKQTGKLKSALRNGKEFHEGSYTSKRLEKYAKMRHLKIKDLFHKVSFKIVNLALTEQVDTIVIGTNQGWKQRVNLGKRNNQHFVSVPFAGLVSMIAYKANKVGIQVIQTEESYTSKASFLDCDPLPVYQEKDKIVFSGKRIKRGLYQSATGIFLNADVNGAYNIIRKVVPKAFANGIEGLDGSQSVNVSTPLALNVR